MPEQITLIFPSDMTEAEAIAYAKSLIPVEHHNDLMTALYTFKNSVLQELHQKGIGYVSK